MKRKLLIVLLVLVVTFSLAFSITACNDLSSLFQTNQGQTDEDDTSSNNETPPSSQDPEQNQTPSDSNEQPSQEPEQDQAPSNSEEQAPSQEPEQNQTPSNSEEQTPSQEPEQDNNQSENTEPEKATVTAGLEYTLSDDSKYYICSGLGTATDTDIVIASSYNDLPVSEIGEKAFYNCSSLTSIIIPDTVTNIENYAFFACNNLMSVTIGNSVTNIGKYAFRDCYKLIEVYNLSNLDITKGTASNGCVGEYALDVYTSKDSVSKLHTIDDYIFYEDENIVYLISYLGTQTKLVLPNKYNKKNYAIIQYAFYCCNHVESITIPDGVISIGEYAFLGCSNLTSITIPNSVTGIKEGSFSYCSSLTSITIPNSVTSIEEGAFSYCSSLTSITIPNSVTSIEGSAFGYCRSLTSITIPSSVTSIEASAFAYCSGLTSINVDSNNTTYHSDGNCLIETSSKKLILGCNNSVIPTDGSVTSIGDGAFYGCSSLTSIAIPNSVESIGSGTFFYCNGLESITIHESVTSIGNYAFYGCSNLTSVYYKGSAEDWSKISIGNINDPLTSATRYYYSETKPTDNGNYWHYVDEVPTVWKDED